MNSYYCRVYTCQHDDDWFTQFDWIKHNSLPITISGQWAISEKMAAAYAYVKACGLLRADMLESLGAPSFTVQRERDPRLIYHALRPGICYFGECYYYDNRVELFYVTSVLLLRQVGLYGKIADHDYSRN